MVVNSNPVIVNRTTRFSCTNARTYLTLGRRNCRIILYGSGPTAVVASAAVTSGICVRPLALRFITGIVHCRHPSTVIPNVNKRANLGLTVRLRRGNVLGRYNIRLLNADDRDVGHTRSHRLFGRLYRSVNRPAVPSRVACDLRRTGGTTVRVNCPIMLHPTFALNNANNNFTCGRRRLIRVNLGTFGLSPIRRILVRGDIGNCGRVRFRIVHSNDSRTVAVYNVRGVSPINIRANSSVIITPVVALGSRSLGVLGSDTVGLVHRLGVRNNYGIRFTLGPRDSRCCLVRMGPHISHSSTLTSGTDNCPVTHIATGVTINVALRRVGVTGAGTTFRPGLSCMVAGLPHFPFSGFAATSGLLNARVGTANRIVNVNSALRRDLLGNIHSLRVNMGRLCRDGFSDVGTSRLGSCVGRFHSSGLFTVTRLFCRNTAMRRVRRVAGVAPFFLRGVGGVVSARRVLGTGPFSGSRLGDTGGVNFSSGCITGL